MQSWPAKDADELLDYKFDWGKKRLESGEIILTSEWEVAQGNVVIESDSIENSPTTSQPGLTKVWLSGGETGEVCIVTNHIVTDAGRHRDWSAKLKIKVK